MIDLGFRQEMQGTVLSTKVITTTWLGYETSVVTKFTLGQERITMDRDIHVQ